MPCVFSSMRWPTISAISCARWRCRRRWRRWSLTSLREKLIKIGAKVVSHGRYVTFQMAEVAVPRQMFAEILSLIARLRRTARAGMTRRRGQSASGNQGRGMPWCKQIGRASALERFSRRSRSLFARGDGDLPLPKPVRSAMLAAKLLVSGECRLVRLLTCGLASAFAGTSNITRVADNSVRLPQ